MEEVKDFILPNQQSQENNTTNTKKEELMSEKDYLSNFKKTLTRDEIVNRCDKLLDSSSPITVFKKSRNGEVYCELEDGTYYTVPVDCTLQLYFDKIAMHPEVDVDFGKVKNTVEVLPYQNRIVYRQAMTGKVLKSIDISSNIEHLEQPTAENDKQEIDSRLNPAILELLKDDANAQNDYMNATGNLKVVYNFEAKTGSFSHNRSNKYIAKEMNKYYKSEIAYANEKRLQNEMSSKIGYVGIIDEIQTKVTKKVAPIINKPSNDSFDSRRAKFLNDVQQDITAPNMLNSTFNSTQVSQYKEESKDDLSYIDF